MPDHGVPCRTADDRRAIIDGRERANPREQ
jgi:hypothetical protein